jgi:hypothetical protein
MCSFCLGCFHVFLLCRCIQPNLPGLLRNITEEQVLSVNNATKLREILGDVVDSSVEVGVVARGGVFFGDELRREATSMKIGEFLDLLDQPTDIPSKHDFYLLQCPFLSCSPSNLSLPLSPLAAVFKVPACANGVGDVDGNLWACHRDAITSSHFDGRDNILTVLKGSKEVELPAFPLFALVHDCMCCCVSLYVNPNPFPFQGHLVVAFRN